MTGGLGSQMFTYAMYLGMRQQFGDDVRIDITNLLHDHEHHGYELHKAFLPPQPVRKRQPEAQNKV